MAVQLDEFGDVVTPTVCSSAYGFCPFCGLPGVDRERRPNGNDRCGNDHVYPSRAATLMQKAKDEPEAHTVAELFGLLRVLLQQTVSDTYLRDKALERLEESSMWAEKEERTRKGVS